MEVKGCRSLRNPVRVMGAYSLSLIYNHCKRDAMNYANCTSSWETQIISYITIIPPAIERVNNLSQYSLYLGPKLTGSRIRSPWCLFNQKLCSVYQRFHCTDFTILHYPFVNSVPIVLLFHTIFSHYSVVLYIFSLLLVCFVVVALPVYFIPTIFILRLQIHLIQSIIPLWFMEPFNCFNPIIINVQAQCIQ